MKKLLFIILLCATAYGANEVRSYYESSLNLYFCVRNSSGQVWYVSGDTFEDWGTGGRDADDYDISLTDKSGSLYLGDFDTDISEGYYSIVIYQKAGANPADTDYALMYEEGYWDGSNWQTTSKQLQNTITDTNEIQTELADGGRTDVLIDAVKAKTDNLPSDPADQSKIDANFAALNDPNVEEIRAEIDANSTQLAEILTDTGTTIPSTLTTMTGYLTNIMADSNEIITYAERWDSNFTSILNDTNELQTDWADGGRLDTILDSIKSMTDLIVLVSTDVKTADDVNSFTLTAGVATADAYNGMNIAIQDADDSHYETRRIKDWTAARVVTVDSDFSFTPAESDVVYIWGISYGGLLDAIYERISVPVYHIDTTGTSSRGAGGTTFYDASGDDP